MDDGIFDAPPRSAQPSPVATDPGAGAPRPAAAPQTGGDRPGGRDGPGSRVLGEPPAGPVDRRCARPTCSRRATATMTYDYGNRTAWVDALTPTALPQGYDLCADHADRLGVPQGWTSTDRRPAYLPDRLAG